MKIYEIISEMTSAGSVASVAMPIGKKGGSEKSLYGIDPSVYKPKTKTKKKSESSTMIRRPKP